MSDHYNTEPGEPQNRDEVEALSDDELTDFMGACEEEPADWSRCLACYAYAIAQIREGADPAELFDGDPSLLARTRRLIRDQQ